MAAADVEKAAAIEVKWFTQLCNIYYTNLQANPGFITRKSNILTQGRG